MPRSFAVHPASFPEATSITRVHRRTSSTSFAYHVTAADGGDYMLKAFPPEHALERSFREACASEIGMQLGLSMAHWTVLQVDEQTCRQGLEEGNSSLGVNQLTAGLYYGSRILEGPGCPRLYLTQRMIQTNLRIGRQLACVRIFDAWLANDAVRGYCAMVDAGLPEHIYFFGHSAIFLPENPESFRERIVNAYRGACTLAGDSTHVHQFLQSIHSYTEADMSEALCSVPAIWKTPARNLQAIAMLCFRRDAMIAVLREEIMGQRT